MPPDIFRDMHPLPQSERDRFDAMVEDAIASLPDEIRTLLEEVPVVVEDMPTRELCESLIREWGADADPEETPERLMQELCGLHDATPFTEETVEAPTRGTGHIMLFRVGILNEAGGWSAGEDAVYEEIGVTLLHEIGHQFGLDEDDLDRLGYA